MGVMNVTPTKGSADQKRFISNGFYNANGIKLTNGLESINDLESADGHYVSEETYWEEYYDLTDVVYEWNNGYLEEKPVGDYVQFWLYVWFLNQLKDFLHVNPIARMIGLELGFRLKLPHKTTVRKPDLGVVLNSNHIPLGDKDRSYRGVFDICIESISDSNKKEVERDTRTKKEEYALAGVTEYYILDERGIETNCFRLSPKGFYVPIQPHRGVIRSAVLPGFQFRLRDLYELPEPPRLIMDPVYNSFSSPFVRAERLCAEAERERADQERKRADREQRRADREQKRATQAENRAARYVAMLKSLGVVIDDE